MRIVLDAGALIALDRRDARVSRLVRRLHEERIASVTHGGVVGQVWRQPSRQVGLARLLLRTEILPLDAALGRDAGRLLAASGTSDVVDAALVALMRDGDEIVTSDPDDIGVLLAVAELDATVRAV